MSAGANLGVLGTSPRTAIESENQLVSGRFPTATTRLIGLAGLLSFDLIVAATFIAPPLWNAPGTRSSATAVALYGQHNATRITVSLFVYSLAMGLFLCFAGGLWSWLRHREGAPQVLSSIFGLATVAASVLILAGFVPTYVLGYRTQPANVAGLLGDLTFGLLALSGIPTALFLAVYAALVIRRGGMPRWTAYLAAVAACAHLLIAASFLSHGAFLSLESGVIVWVPATFFLWILVVSAAFYRGRVDLS
jgi:hypothetical protein